MLLLRVQILSCRSDADIELGVKTGGGLSCTLFCGFFLGLLILDVIEIILALHICVNWLLIRHK